MNIKDGKYLDVVDENDNVIGKELRTIIHRDGLRHREIHAWFVNKEGVYFQHRSKDKDTFPDMLDATIGGHVEIGDTYEYSVLKELEEESGLILKINDLNFIIKEKTDYFDKQTKTQNNTFRFVYYYNFDGNVDELKIEKGKSQGFVFISWKDLLVGGKNIKKIIPMIYSGLMEMYKNNKFNLK